MVKDDQVYEFVRGAALDAFLVLVHTGQMSRQIVAEYYQSLLRCRRPPDLTLSFLTWRDQPARDQGRSERPISLRQWQEIQALLSPKILTSYSLPGYYRTIP